jgi:hypothetical protein
MNRVTERLVLIIGRTYPVRAELKALGGTWDAGAKGWRVPEAKVDMARDLIAHGPARRPRYSPRYSPTYRRAGSGGEVMTKRNGRCEDAPSCACCI